MEHLGEFSCRDCNMMFRSFGLLDKHKTRFCIGSEIGDPAKLRRRLKISEQKSALRGVSPKRTHTPDLISLREQRNKLMRQKDKRETDPQDSVAESLVNKLTDEFHKLRMSIEETLARRPTERVDEERFREMCEHHEQKMAEIRAHNTQLEQKRLEIERQMTGLPGLNNSAHLEELLEELKDQEQKNEVILHQLSTQINGLQGTKEAHVPSDLQEEKKSHVTFDLISVDGPLSSQIRSLRLTYMQSGGSDPEVLAHMHDLQSEAYTLEQTRARANHKAERSRIKSSQRPVDSDVMAVEHENQRLEEEIFRLRLIRERYKGKDVGSDLIQKHQIHQLATLQAEISGLRREVEKGLERRAGGPLAETNPALARDHSLKHTQRGRHVLDLLDTLGPAPYDPVAGFVIFYDVVLGVDAAFRAVRLVARLYSGGKEMGRPTPMPPVQCQPAGAQAYPSGRNPGNYALLSVKQPVPRIQPSPNLSLVLEVQAAGDLDSFGQEILEFMPRGWTRLQLFDQHNQVLSGFWRAPFRSLPLRPTCSPSQLNSVPQLSNMEICLRVVNARDSEVQSLTKIDPNNTSLYKFPPTVISNSSQTPQFTSQLLPNHFPSSHPQSDHMDPLSKEETLKMIHHTFKIEEQITGAPQANDLD